MNSSERQLADSEPIAIVSMACRYPGDVSSPEGLWQLVTEGRDAISPFPDNRGWDLETLFDPDAVGRSSTRHGGFLHNAADFDPEPFGISPKEAMGMDPQQRMLLETSWELLERAGIAPTSVRDSSTGVFVGLMYNDYWARFVNDGHHRTAELTLGSAPSVAVGRISYVLGLHGPSVAVDTACSSSLVAIHWAMQALRAGECPLAVVGGATVMSTPNSFVTFSKMQGLSPDGRCKSYAGAAVGTGWGEGVGLLLLERLSDARRNGHPVLALIRGSAVNSDGSSKRLTTPSGPAQEQVILGALASAGLSPADVDVVDGHGTGTALGDPIEAEALLATYGQTRETPLLLGSVKSNIGHSQAAAGVGGIIKMVQAMRYGTVPRTLHVDQPLPQVDWSGGSVELVVRERPWPQSHRPRRAAVSGFGIGGTNGHVILEQAPDEERESPTGTGPAVPWLLSGASAEALRAQADELSTVAPRPTVDVSWTLAVGRSALKYRAAVPAGDHEALAALAAGERHPAVISGQAGDHRLAVLFTGQGSQRQDMGVALSEFFSVFAKSFSEVCEGLDRHLERPLREVISDHPDLLHRTDFAQAGIFAYEVAMYRLLESWGVRPDYLAGHSVGELVAAHVAGVLDLADAAAMVTARSRLMSALPAGGAMVAVEADEAEAADVLAGVTGVVVLAAVNGPRSVVLSGQDAAVAAAAGVFEARGRRTRRLLTSHAFHSPLIEPMLADFRTAITNTAFRAPQIPIISTATGLRATAEELAVPEYWVNQARHTVRFADGVRTLDASGVTAYLEVGPSSALASLVEENTAAAAPVVATTSRNRTGEVSAALDALSHLHVNGLPVDWEAVFAGTGARHIELPTYPFRRKRYWQDRRIPRTVGGNSLGHPLLNHSGPVPGTGRTLCWGTLSTAYQPWLADHVVGGRVILPATAFVELAGRAGDEVQCPVTEELVVHTPLVLPSPGEVLVQVLVGEPDEQGRRSVEVYTCPAEDRARENWSQHATGTLTPDDDSPVDVPEFGEWPPPGAIPVDVGSGYAALADEGLEYRSAFQNVKAAWRRGDEVFAEVLLAKEWRSQDQGFRLHPALFDAALHALVLASPREATEDAGIRLPFALKDVRLFAADVHKVRVRLRRTDDGDLSLDLFSPHGAPVARAGSVVTKAAPLGGASGASAGSLYAIEWTAIGPSRGGTTAAADAVVRCEGESSGPNTVAAVHTATSAALNVLQNWIADESHQGGRLVLVTRNATAADPDLAAAAVWGLARTAQMEHPDRVVLIDLDGSTASEEALPAAMASGEPQLALRGGATLVPRFVRREGDSGGAIDTSGTVLITGGTGSLGSLLAGHLATAHGARNLLLVSRSGMAADRLAELRAGLPDDTRVQVVACDVADEAALARLSGEAQPPLSAIVHAAGVLDDGVLGALTPDRVATVFRPKVDAAWHLHELAERAGITSFVLFSSITGQVGSPGQGSYAAANSFLDALARYRTARGMPALSLAWGPWGHGTGMAADLIDTGPLTPLSAEDSLALFDSALGAGTDVLAPILVNRRKLGPSRMPVPAVLQAMVRTTRSGGTASDTVTGPSAWRARLARLPVNERLAEMTTLVRSEAADILGYSEASAMPSGQTFGSLGFDSLGSITFRNRLNAATGLRLPTTIAFDVPTLEKLGAYLLDLLTERQPTADPSLAPQAPAGGRLASFYRGVCESGDFIAAMNLLIAASRALPTFGAETSRQHVVQPTRMASGPNGPALVCFPSFFPPAGLGTYGRFAECFEGDRDMFEIQYPG